MHNKQPRFLITRVSASLFAVASAMICSSSGAQSNPAGSVSSLRGLQSVYLQQPANHYFAGSDGAAGNSTVRVDFTSLLKAPYNHIYINGAALQRSVQTDQALAAFWNDPTVGHLIQEATAHPMLVSELPTTPFSGMNAVNSSPQIFRRMRRAKLGKTAPGKAGIAKLKGPAAIRQAAYRLATQTMLSNYTTILMANQQGTGYTMLVLGRLPSQIDTSIPVNYTLEARQYLPGQTDSAGNPVSQNDAVIDSLALPASAPGRRYFCFEYQLTPLATSSKDTLVASYWASALVSLEQAVGLGSGATGNTVAVPGIQVKHYFRFHGDSAMLLGAKPGDSLTVDRKKEAIMAILERRKAFFQSHPFVAMRLKRQLAALNASNP